MPELLVWILVVGTGACVGSFLNVCIHRLPRRQSIVLPRSACPACGAPIAWYDNLPVLSYLILRGRCRRCRAPISAAYPLVEAATAALFGLLLHARGPTVAFLVQAYLGAALIALILIDARHQILPDALTLPGIAAGLLTSPIRAGATGLPPAGAAAALADALAGAALGYAIPWGINAAYRGWQAVRGVPAAAREDGIGRGDFKLLAMIGAFLGLPLLLFCLFVGAVTGAAFALAMMRFAGYGWKSRLPYGVFLGGAAILALFAGDPTVRWYLGVAGIGP
jgi:leader peptidase (prepilin peptidase)/N-methyltransferase